MCDTEELIGGEVTCAGLEISVTTHYAQKLGTSVTALNRRFTNHKALCGRVQGDELILNPANTPFSEL